MEPVVTVAVIMNHIHDADKTEYRRVMIHLYEEYGTALMCNRFPIGNVNEYAIAEVIRSTPLKVEETQNARRDDIIIFGFGGVSIKYCSTPTLILHNSQGQNKDITMHNTLLVTPTEWWFLSPSEIQAYGVDLSKYLNNRSDSLTLKLKQLLKELKAKNYPHHFDFDTSVDKKTCKNKEISRIVYDHVKAVIQQTSTQEVTLPRT